MSPADPTVLWLAAALCAAMALRARGAARRPLRSRAPGAVPGWLRRAGGVRWPAPLCERARRIGDERRVVGAGVDGAFDEHSLARARLTLVALGVLAGVVLGVTGGPAGMLAGIVVIAAAPATPGRWLATRARRRRATIVRELPDLMDLLGICVGAGMALDPALALAVDRLGGLLGEEVARMLADLRFGMPRPAAYRALVDRVGVPELTQAVAALLQADELGSPLSGALAGQAASLRAARRQAARDRAAKAAPQIQLVVALVMVPAVLLLVLGVLIIELSRQVGAVVGG